MFTRSVALVSQTNHVQLSELTIVAAALQKQVNRDFRRYWEVEAAVSAFARLKDVPLGYWPIIIRDDIHQDNAAGIHLNASNGQPYALVQFDPSWTLTISHECIEMLADPSGNRIIAGDSVKKGQGRVQYLVEVCDPSEDAANAYSVNGVLVSDFYTPAYFDPVSSPSTRYSFTGAITKPRQVLNGGYLSWLHPPTRHLWQLFVDGGKRQFVDQGPLPDGFKSLRVVSDRCAARRRASAERHAAPDHLLLRTSRRAATELDPALDSEAEALQEQIEAVLRGDPDGAGTPRRRAR